MWTNSNIWITEIYYVVILVTTLYLFPCTRGVGNDDGLSYLRDEMFRKVQDCNGLTLYSQFKGVDAEKTQKQAEDRYSDCMASLADMADGYIEKKAAYEGKSVDKWLKDTKNSEVYFSKSYNCAVLKVTKNNGKQEATTYVYLPQKYNWVSKYNKKIFNPVSDNGLDFLRNEMVSKDAECASLYVSSQFEGADADGAQKQAEERYSDCTTSLADMANSYIGKKATYNGESVDQWLKDPKNSEVYFSEPYNRFVLKVTKDNGKQKTTTLVYLPQQYNQVSKINKKTFDSISNDGLSFLRNEMVVKDAECASLYVPSQYESEHAGMKVQKEAVDRYNNCKADLASLAEIYIRRKANYEGKPLKQWLKDSKSDVFFSTSTYCYVLTVTDDDSTASAYVYLSSKHNPPDYATKPHASEPKKDYSATESQGEPHLITPTAKSKERGQKMRKGLKAKLKFMFSQIRDKISLLLPRKNQNLSDSQNKKNK